jgi:NADPH:quinone reductase-like Zn-dependent oxidoreductase
MNKGGESMKAIVCTKYGSPEVLKLQDVEKPVPKDDEVLIKLFASTVSPSDCAFRKGEPFMVRFFNGLLKPKHAIQGEVLAGEIEKVGKDVTLFKQGDQVFGSTCTSFGAYAQYKCLSQKNVLAIKPVNMNFNEAATICDGAITALPFLRDNGKIQKGHKVLIYGASGSVGTFAIQIAKYYGAQVSAVCSTANIEMVRSLGADTVIDYTKTDFTNNGETYDIIFDVVCRSSYSRCKASLTKKGTYLTTLPTASVLFHMLWTAKGAGKKAVFAATGIRPAVERNKDIRFLRSLIEEGKIKSVIDRRYSLDETAEAHRYVETGRKKGNVVITIDHSAE